MIDCFIGSNEAAEVEVEVNLRPTVSRPVYVGFQAPIWDTRPIFLSP
jgi:hypothetical protein